MADTVKVSLIQPQAFRESKDVEYTRYPAGIVDMPMEHAKALGVTHRIVRERADTRPFNGVFDARLVQTLDSAGYRTFDDLRGLSQDELMAIEGIGPASYERIQAALRGI